MATDETRPADSSAAGGTANPGRRRRRGLRIGLLVAGPLLVFVVGAWIYMHSGRIAATDNAYVKADLVVLSAEVAGRIVAVNVEENEAVHTDQLLVEIDDSSYRVAKERAESQLETVRSLITGLRASYRQELEKLELARTDVEFAEREVAREESLARQQLGSERDLDLARYNLDSALQQIPIIEQRLAQLRAQLGGRTDEGFEGHAAFRAVRSMLADAQLELAHTAVRAPIDGVVSHVPLGGSYVARGAPIMSLVSTDHIWIEANYKETQLTYVRVGQPAVVHIDTYPDREWHGRVESISQATGTEFSVIPAQNASGNWVKVAQRIPVRIVLDDADGSLPLRAGMSAVVEIDTGHRREAPPMLGFLEAFADTD